MKQIIIILFYISLGLSFLSAVESGYRDARVQGLGGAYTAVADDSNTLYLNPAGLHGLIGSSMYLRLDLLDTINGDVSFGSGLNGMFQNPILTGEFLYTNRNWGISASSKYAMNISGENPNYSFDVTKMNSVHIGFAAGIGPLSLGTNIKATMQNKEDEITVQSDESVGIVIPFVQGIILHDYSSSNAEEAEEHVVMGVGMLLDIWDFSIGVYSDEFLDFMHGDEDSDTIVGSDLLTIFNGLNIGVSYKTHSYTTYGDYTPLQFIVAADGHNLGDDDNRTLLLGMETNLRFLEYVQLAVRFGYQEDIPQWDDLVYGLSLKDGKYTVGIGAVLPFVKIDAALALPAESLMYQMNPVGDYTGDSGRVQLTFGFSF